jgi:hypothetical protein
VESVWIKHLSRICVQELISLPKGNFHKKYYQGWWRKLKSFIFFQHWHNVILQLLVFDLWMSKRAFDVFALGNDWQPKHVIISLFETIETVKQTLAQSLINLLDKCYITTYVKNEKFNFNIMTSALKLIVCHEFLG